MTRFSVGLTLVVALQLSGCKGDQPSKPALGAGSSDATKPPEGSSKSLGFKAIAGAIEALNARKWDAAGAIYATDARWTTPGQPSGKPSAPIVGRRAALSIWKDLANWFPDLSLVVIRMVKLPRGYLVESWVGGTASSAVQPLGFKPGTTMGASAAELLTVKQGQVTQVESWGGMAQVRAQLSGKATAEARPPAPAAGKVPQVAGTAATEAVDGAVETLGIEGADWAEGAGNVVVVAKAGALWVVTLDEAGAVASKRRYGAGE